MKQTRLWAQARSLATKIAVLLSLFAALPASAQDSQEKLVVWYNMHTDAHGREIADAKRQCLKDAAQLSWLSTTDCDEFERMLEEGQCKVEMVEDGVVYDAMNGMTAKGIKMTQNMVKKLGRTDRALTCVLSNGRTIDWFTGHEIDGKYVSCNNVGIRRKEVMTYRHITVPDVPPPTPTAEWVCVKVPIAGSAINGTVVQQQDGIVIQSDCCCADDLAVPSLNYVVTDTIQSSGHRDECGWVQTK